jgi:hypothetical protein
MDEFSQPFPKAILQDDDQGHQHHQPDIEQNGDAQDPIGKARFSFSLI